MLVVLELLLCLCTNVVWALSISMCMQDFPAVQRAVINLARGQSLEVQRVASVEKKQPTIQRVKLEAKVSPAPPEAHRRSWPVGGQSEGMSPRVSVSPHP